MKRLTSIFLCVLLVLSFALSANAQAPKIIDNADLLTASEEVNLEKKARALADTYQMDVVILTVPSLGSKSPVAYADDYFDNNGYGIGSDYSGIILVFSTEYRDCAISTCGKTISAISDYDIESIFDELSGYFSEDQYYNAFDDYLTELDNYFDIYRNGETLTFGDYVIRFLIALVIGAAIAGIALLTMRGNMNTAKSQSGAKSYIVSGSYDLFRQQDIFLYSRTTRTRKAQNNGGSSTHRSSSGRSHGGGSRRF